MWSDKYYYYNVQYDKHFNQKLDKAFVVNCLLETKFFKQISHQTFTNSDKFPWVNIALIETDNGSFVLSEKENQFVSLIAIVCSKGENINQQLYIDTFREIANKLNWKLYLEEDDDGNENVEL